MSNANRALEILIAFCIGFILYGLLTLLSYAARDSSVDLTKAQKAQVAIMRAAKCDNKDSP